MTEHLHYDWTGELIEWRGPSPYFFVPMDEDDNEDLHEVASEVTYGWGVIPVRVRVGRSEWDTSLFPRDGVYMVPMREKIRRAETLTVGDEIHVQMWVEQRHGRPAR